jgi:hypothetical protein
MLITRKFVTKAAMATITVASLLGAGVSTASHAGAAVGKKHHVHCRLKHGHNYPPGKCYIEFNKGKYHRGDSVKFKAASFKPGSTVREHLRCKSFHKHVGSATAGNNGTINDSFTLPKHTPKATCTVAVHGGGSRVEGHIKARH